jgi:hypothetical protein
MYTREDEIFYVRAENTRESAADFAWQRSRV